MEVQTREQEGALRFFTNLKEAFDYAESNHNVWKVSFNAEDGTRVRLVRVEGNIWGIPSWKYEPIIPEIRPTEEDRDEEVQANDQPLNV